MPTGFSSARSPSNNVLTPALLVLYASNLGKPRNDARLEMPTRCPAFRWIIPGSTAATEFATPIRLTRMTLSKSAARKSYAEVSMPMPAFATRMEIGRRFDSSDWIARASPADPVARIESRADLHPRRERRHRHRNLGVRLPGG